MARLRGSARRWLLATAGGAGCIALAFLVAIWPVTTGLASIVVVGLLLAWWRPAWALALAALLFGLEGTIKILLGIEPTPLPFSARAVGAAALDACLFPAIAGLLLRDRLVTLRRLWQTANRAERATALLFGAWLALSLIQILVGGNPARGLKGFRLFQAYLFTATATAVVFARDELRHRATQVLCAIGLVVSLYAAVRVFTGPASIELNYVLSTHTVISYGGAIRAVGSFSSAVGLSSFLAPLATFGLVLGLVDKRLRWPALALALLCIVALIGSYTRAALLGLVVGLIFALVVLLAVVDMTPRAKFAYVLVALVAVLGAYGGVQIASHASHQLRERAHGVLDPFHDKSVELRFTNWRHKFDAAVRTPLGHGLGSVGGASSSDPSRAVTTDNSYLKVLFEQGFLGLALFVLALASAVVVLGRRLRGLAGEARPLGLAALAGFATFLGMSTAGEYVEQPGKVIAWGLLGMAAGLALGTSKQAPVA